MENEIFVNEAVTYGINNILNNSNNDDFLTKVISTLINIYGQLDIINPYKTKKESSFDNNIIKFGYSRENLSLFKQNLQEFYLTKENKPNKYFNQIEFQLIDMYYCKIKSVKQDTSDIESFKKNICFSDSEINKIYSVKNNEIDKYWSYKNKLNNNKLEYDILENNTLNKDAYSFIGYSYDNIKNMNEMELENINRRVFEYFKIDINREDRFLRLDQALEYYKDLPKPEEVKQENGYVEFILLTAFVAISILILAIVVGVLSR